MADLRYIPLTLTTRYASTWGVWEGVRELVQNWHDGLYQMVDNLDIVSSTPLQVQFKKASGKGLQDEFEAFVINPENQDKVVLGVLIFDGLENRLTLINKSTALHKRILLMGYSAKTEKHEVIGQFGEGLKVGALSLVRDGRPVTMETSTDRWRFDLIHNEEFGEKVLTVIVSGRKLKNDDADALGLPDDTFPLCPVNLESSDTCTSVTNLSQEEWKTFLPRFLFLTPASNSVETGLGTLLLDDLLAGQLYVKGVWVSDLRGEDLAAGVDFSSLQLDRDRNAVPRPSEIDHLVSGIWIKAVLHKPDLIGKYYKLLLHDKYRDVRHAAQYVTNTLIPAQVSNFFISDHGKDAIPVLNTISMKKLQEIRRELSSKVVLCNQTMLNILNQSGKHISVEEALLDLHSRRPVQMPYSELSEEQQIVLRHAGKLIQMTDKNFSLGCVDIVQTGVYEPCTLKGSRVVIPFWLLDLNTVHYGKRLCPFTSSHCLCREVWICCAVLDACKERLSNLRVHVSHSDLLNMTHLHYLYISPHQPVIALLAKEVCDRTARGFCSDLHSHSSLSDRSPADKALISELEEREKTYLSKISSLEKALEEQLSENMVKLSELKKKLEAAESELATQEISLVNAEEKIRIHCEAKLQKAKDAEERNFQQYQRQLKGLCEDIVELRKDVQFKGDLLKKQHKQSEREAEAFKRKEENLLEELRHYIEKHKNRTELLSRICEEGVENADEDVKEKCVKLAEICDTVLQDLQTEKFLCAVCKLRRKDTMFQPCGHYAYCSDCADSLLKSSGLCPLCKREATELQIVYE